MVEDDVELGFLDSCEYWQVESRLFPSKVGGKPAWLNLENLPSSEQLKCKKCEETMIFLCQLYAPFEEDTQHSFEDYLNNFHRTIFVFICRNSSCCERNNSDNVKVLRSSLQRINKFYPYDPPEDKPEPDFCLGKWVNLCNICGCLSEKQCSKCKKVYYCSRHHQILDWKEGHKKECESKVCNLRTSKMLFDEWEIITETEEISQVHTTDEEELQKFEQLQIEGKTGTMVDTPESDLETHAVSDNDKCFSKFQKRVEHNPDQVIRYKRGGQPLWISADPIPEKIPDCEACKGPRQFEFQIMPQMLSYLKEVDIDWGILAVYTCKHSCSEGSDYKEEFIFKQDVTLST